MTEDRLRSWDPETAELLGSGGEADVYSLDDASVVRLYRDASPETVSGARHRKDLCDEIARGVGTLAFATPIVLEQGEFRGRCFQIEERLHGTSLLSALDSLDTESRERVITAYMDTAWSVAEIDLGRPYFGEIGRTDAIQTTSWQQYLCERATNSLASSPLSHIDAVSVAEPLGEPESVSLVHIDYFPGNVMTNGQSITAVIDWGYSTIIGDRRMNAMVAAAHLMTPRITPNVTDGDRDVAMRWLADHKLVDYFEQSVPWLAAYWAFAHDDADLLAWSRSILT